MLNLLAVKELKNYISNSKATCVNSDGYKVVTINKTQYRVHRVLYCAHHGLELSDIEGLVVDHINGDRADNRIENLRLLTVGENNKNTHKSRSGVPAGITYDSTRDRWRVRVNKKHYGRFKTLDEAVTRLKEVLC